MENPQNNSLVALVQESSDIIQALVDAGGELTPELEMALRDIDAKVPVKVDRMNWVIDRLGFEAEFWRLKADEMKKVAKGHENAEQFLRQLVKDLMINHGITSLEGNESRFLLKNREPELIITCEASELPPEFVDEELVVTHKINKKKIKEFLLANPDKAIPGVELRKSYAMQPVPVWKKNVLGSKKTTKEISDGKGKKANQREAAGGEDPQEGHS